MIIKINGKEESVDRAQNLTELISHKGLVADHIVIEHNSRIVPKEEWGSVIIEENDNIEIVSFVGGG